MSQNNKLQKYLPLFAALANLLFGFILMMNSLFANANNQLRNSSGSYSITWVAVPVGLLVSAIALIQIVALLILRTPARPKIPMNSQGQIAIGLAGLCVVLVIFNAAFPLGLLLGIPMIILARKSKINALSSILYSGILAAFTLELTLSSALINY
jgi:hypothetical protein